MSEPNDDPEKEIPLLPTEEINQQRKSHELVEKFEAFAMQNSSKSLDYSKLSPEQVDKVLGIMEKNEDNAFSYHTKKLETVEKIRIAELSSKTSGQRTLRIMFICSIIVVFILTFTILIYKENFFIPWITFLGGNLSGVGLSKVPKLFTNSTKSSLGKIKKSTRGEYDEKSE